MSKEAMKLALEALEYIDLVDNDRDFLHSHECYMIDQAITALKALAEQPAPVQEPDKHQEYIDSLLHDPDSEEKMLTQIYHWARQSYSRHQQSVRGQMITDADSSNNHIIWAALRWAKENPSPQAQQEPVGLPESETEEMHDAVMEVLYQGGVTRGNTYLLWQAYRKVLAATPQAHRKRLTPTLEADTGYSHAQRAAFKEGWEEAEAAHGIKDTP